LVAAAVAAALGLAFPALTRMRVPPALTGIAAAAGAASYPLYLLHAEFGLALGIGLWPMVAAVIVLSLALGRIEAPLRRRIRRIAIIRGPIAAPRATADLRRGGVQRA
jgi:peptidoglycan/LPS O-acetylase OafA/YrhL